MNKKLLIVAIFLIIIIIAGVYIFTSTYWASEDAKVLLNDSKVCKTDSGLFIDGAGNDTAIIFYPGAFVEYTSYLPLMDMLADRGVDCFLVEMPLNLAIFDENSAEDIIGNYNYSHYYIAGHSLGGVAASDYASKNPDNIDGVILLASYSTENISNLKVLSVYGSEDHVLNMEKYNESLVNLGNFTEVVIDGANHAQFGEYGAQKGDGVSKISGEKQRNESINAILSFV